MSRPCIVPPPNDLALHDARRTPPKPMPVPVNLGEPRTGVVARAELLATAQPERLARVTANARPGRCHECKRVGATHSVSCSKRTTDRVEES
jgi:hypothetical protein